MAFDGFLSRRGIKHPVELESGDTLEVLFKPISVRRLLFLQDVIGAGAKALMSLMSGNSFDELKTTQHREKDGFVTTVNEPADPEVMARKLHAKEAALDDLITVLFAPENVDVVGQLLLNSLRDDDLIKDHDGEISPKEFFDGTEPGALRQLVVGFTKANKKVLPGPLAKRLKTAWERALSRLDDPTTLPDDDQDQNLEVKPDENFESSSKTLPDEEPQETMEQAMGLSEGPPITAP